MEENVSYAKIYELAGAWESLRCDVAFKGNLFSEEFKKTFNETYEILRELAGEREISKEYMPLLLNVAYFAKLADFKDDSRMCASVVLAERMLQYCLSYNRSTFAMEDHSSVYSLKERKEVIVNFKDVDGALDAVATVVDANRDY